MFRAEIVKKDVGDASHDVGFAMDVHRSFLPLQLHHMVYVGTNITFFHPFTPKQ